MAPSVAFLMVVGGNFSCDASGGHGVNPRLARRAPRWASAEALALAEGVGFGDVGGWGVPAWQAATASSKAASTKPILVPELLIPSGSAAQPIGTARTLG